jgi:hypothetical protein
MSLLGFFHRALPRFNRWFQGVAVASNVESGGKPADINAVGVSALLNEITRADDEPQRH